MFLNSWAFWARPNQILPKGNWFCWLLLCGRGFGKTRTGAETCLELIGTRQAKRIIVVAPTHDDLKKTVFEGESGLISCLKRTDLRYIYNKSSNTLTFPDLDAILTGYSAEEPERLRGPQSDFAWFDELAAAKYHKETWDMLLYGLRLGSTPRIMVTTTPKPLDLLKGLVEKLKTGYTVITKGSSYENISNLSQQYYTNVIAPKIGTRQGRQEIFAELLGDVPGAFWTDTICDMTRVGIEGRPAPSNYLRIVIGVDPATTYGEESAETGIIVCGKSVDGHFYVLEDASGRWAPEAWAAKVVQLYDKWEADKIIAEGNQGGELLTAILGTVRRNLPLEIVHARKSKQARAEPVSALWVQEKAHLVGHYHKKRIDDTTSLEDQMTQWVAEEGEESPDRLDAMVWAMTALAL